MRRSLKHSGSHLNWILIALIALVGGCRNIPDDLNRYMDKAVKSWRFRGAVIVAHDGQPVLSRGYGYANQLTGQLNTTETKFYIGSLTKPFTAAAVLLLAERSQLKLDDPITSYLPDYPADPGERITIRHLLSHSSGLPNYTDRPEILLNRDNRMDLEQLVNSFKSRPLRFEPGTKFEYCNSGYVLLGLIIENVSGQSYEAFLNREILKPLGLRNTGYGRREARYPGGAVGYTSDEESQLVSALPTHLSVLYSAGALFSTAEDLLKWDEALNGEQLLTPESRAAMFSPQIDNYGLGWFVDSLYGQLRISHGGIIDGFNCAMERWPKDKLTIIVLSNDDRTPVDRIAGALSAICYGQPYQFPIHKEPIELESRELARYVGAYQLGEDLYRLITLERGVLYAQSGDLPRERLAPESDQRFFYESDNSTTLTFESNDSGRVVSQILQQDGRRYQADRVFGPVADSLLGQRSRIRLLAQQCNALTGIYLMDPEFEELGEDLTLTVSCLGSRLFISIGEGNWVELLPSSPTEFFHPEVDLFLSFGPEEDKIDNCVLNMGQAVVKADRIVAADSTKL